MREYETVIVLDPALDDARVEQEIEETLTFFRLPVAHHKHLKSTNLLERLNEEIKRRTQVVRIFRMSGVVCG